MQAVSASSTTKAAIGEANRGRRQRNTASLRQELGTDFGEPGGTRTRDHRIKSAMLYQLSYRPLANSGKVFIVARV